MLIQNSVLKVPVQQAVNLTSYEKDNDITLEPVSEIKYLFTTKTCPNCKIAKEYLQNEAYVVLDAAENPELVQKYGIMTAPTLVVVKGNEVQKYVNASNIKRYVDEKATVSV